MDKTLSLLGLMRRANAIAIGETATGNAARSGEAKLLLLASDASDNAAKRIRGFAEGRKLKTVTLPYTKDEIAAATGKVGCSMAAICDRGFADALMKRLSESEIDAQREHEEGKRRNNI